MGVTLIEWTGTLRVKDGSMAPGYTFNPWRGCVKISPACANCYAEKTSKRNPKVLGEWGYGTNRSHAAPSYWNLPLRWNKEAEKAGERRKVFCASLADVFEDRSDLVEARHRLFCLIMKTPHLDWLLLTKRPENIRPHLEEIDVWDELPLSNVWFGTTVENQEYANLRIPSLMKIPGPVRFLSVEPMLGPVNLRRVIYDHVTMIDALEGLHGWPIAHAPIPDGVFPINWVIAGGESGSDARLMHPDWVRGIRDDCAETKTPFFFKQWGKWRPKLESIAGYPKPICKDEKWGTLQRDGKWWPVTTPWNGRQDKDSETGEIVMVGLDKKKSGRVLDGLTHNDMPVSQ